MNAAGQERLIRADSHTVGVRRPGVRLEVLDIAWPGFDAEGQPVSLLVPKNQSGSNCSLKNNQPAAT
jgi:hypothetical protein